MTTIGRVAGSEAEQVKRDINHAFEFMHEVIDDPAILDRIPCDATVTAVPKSDAEANRVVDFETPNMVVYLGPSPSNGTIDNESRSSRRRAGRARQAMHRVVTEVVRHVHRVARRQAHRDQIV